MILKMTDVKKTFKSFFLDISMEVREGYVTGLIGINGAGKSTTFKLILNLIKKDSGTIEILGKDSSKISIRDKEDIGVVLGEAGFSKNFRIKDIIPILDSMYHSFDKKTFIKYCEENRLPFDKKIRNFSTGMLKRLNIITAITHNAKLLVLDEPTAGLDVVARERILDMLRHYMETEGRAIIISSHISYDLEGFCDDIYMIRQGKIAFHEDMVRALDEYGILKLTQEQYDEIDKSHLLYTVRKGYGFTCLTDEIQFYLDNYKNIIIEKSHLDDFIMLIEKGEAYERSAD